MIKHSYRGISKKSNCVLFYRFQDDHYIYYDFEEKKYYWGRGSNSKFEPGIAFYAAICLAPFVFSRLDEFYLPIRTLQLNIALIVAGIFFISICAFIWIRKIENKTVIERNEIYKLKDKENELSGCIKKGKKMLRKQLIIILLFFLPFLAAVTGFIFWGYSWLLISAWAIWFILFILIVAFKPYKLVSFFKQYDAGEIELFGQK